MGKPGVLHSMGPQRVGHDRVTELTDISIPIYTFHVLTQTVKNLLAMQGPRFHPWVRKTPWRRKCNPLQYSCLDVLWREEPGGLQSNEIGRAHV